MTSLPFLLVSTKKIRPENSLKRQVFACLKTSGFCLFLGLQNLTRGLGKSSSINMGVLGHGSIKDFPKK